MRVVLSDRTMYSSIKSSHVRKMTLDQNYALSQLLITQVKVHPQNYRGRLGILDHL